MRFDQLRLDHPALPADVLPSECDGRPDPLADADPQHLWDACSSAVQERIADEFCISSAEEVRDAVLLAEDAAQSGISRLPETAAAVLASVGLSRFQQRRVIPLGRTLWSAWVRYRDVAVHRLRRGGQI